MLTHPTLDQLRALKLDGMAEAFIELEAQERGPQISRTPNGWRCCSTARPPSRNDPALPDPAARRPAAAQPGLRSRTSTTARRAGSTRRCSSSWPPAAGSPSTAACSSPGRAASASRGSPARWRRRPAATATPSTTPACRACSPISISPTATAASRGCSACSSRSICSILDDWGPDRLSASQRRDLMEIVEDRYGRGSTLITSQLPVDHLARGDRRADARRRHPRSHRPQRLPARARRPVDAQAQSQRGDRRRRRRPTATTAADGKPTKGAKK